MPADLRDIAPIIRKESDQMTAWFGGVPTPEHMYKVLHQCWPECYTSEFSGKVIMAPKDADLLEKLFELFGVPMKVADNSEEMLRTAFKVIVVGGLADDVEHILQFPTGMKMKGAKPLTPGSYKGHFIDYSPDWLAYVEAVAREDKVEARRLAKKLKVLQPDCEYPESVIVDKVKAPTLNK